MEWARFDEGPDGLTPGLPVAVGSVRERHEIMCPTEVLPRRVHGLNDREDLMAQKTRIDVLHDPCAMNVAGSGRCQC